MSFAPWRLCASYSFLRIRVQARHRFPTPASEAARLADVECPHALGRKAAPAALRVEPARRFLERLAGEGEVAGVSGVIETARRPLHHPPGPEMHAVIGHCTAGEVLRRNAVHANLPDLHVLPPVEFDRVAAGTA